MVIKIQIMVKPLQMSVLPYSTKMVLTHSTYKVFTNRFLLGLLRSQAIISDQNGALRLDKWKVHFLPPLGIKDNAKFNTAFVLKISVTFFSLTQYLYLHHS